jgi:aminoglycoside phosphotransferase (APT) family kinase protein
MVDGIHAENVTEWFVENIPGAVAPLSFELIAGGRSNLTYKVSGADDNGYVLRRPPLGHVLESAHDMGREHKIISSLGPTDIPVAPALGLCKDNAVNGADFYVMKFVEGRVFTDSTDAVDIPEDSRRGLGLNVIENLVKLHNINPDDVGLGDLGKKEDYVGRQVRRWTKQWENSKTEEVPEMDEVGRLLKENMPVQIGASIAHGDYRIGNFMIKDYRIAAVLDWELCTLGDALADVAYLLNWWYTADEVDLGVGDGAPTAVGGFPSREELVEYYEKATGRDLGQINYYRALSYWRLAAISQGVYRRYMGGAMGDTGDIDPSFFTDRLLRLAGLALEMLT